MKDLRQWKEGMEAIYPPQPTPHTLSLYKYVNADVLLYILQEGKMKISFRTDANDPFEGLPSGEDPATSAYHEELGFLSFSASNNTGSLWGNYADSYRGACIEFSIPIHDTPISKFTQTLCGIECVCRLIHLDRNPQKGDSRVVLFNAGDIIVKCRYEHQRADLSKIESGFKDSKNLEHFCQHLLPIATKEESWRYEKEYRAIISDEYLQRDKQSGMCFTSDFMRYISRIIITPRAKLKQKQIEALLQHTPHLPQHVSVITAPFSRTTFQLDIPDK